MNTLRKSRIFDLKKVKKRRRVGEFVVVVVVVEEWGVVE